MDSQQIVRRLPYRKNGRSVIIMIWETDRLFCYDMANVFLAFVQQIFTQVGFDQEGVLTSLLQDLLAQGSSGHSSRPSYGKNHSSNWMVRMARSRISSNQRFKPNVF